MKGGGFGRLRSFQVVAEVQAREALGGSGEDLPRPRFAGKTWHSCTSKRLVATILFLVLHASYYSGLKKWLINLTKLRVDTTNTQI
jgi:hypothetical protein